MISQLQLENRIFDYLNTLYGADALLFGFSTDVNQRFIVDRQTNAPRVGVGTILYFRVEQNVPRGINRGSFGSIRDASTNQERVEMWRDVNVIINILSQDKGKARDAMNFLLAMVNTERDARASLEVLPFDLLLHRIGDIKNLTALETESWQERIESDWFFNYQDTVILSDVIQWPEQPTTPEDVPNIIEWETKLKDSK